ncbi:hypothetical protein IIA29_03370, partial [candidate division KSB1 bacterium]|nr:hypothetical protein [candidate division KSB1 bacterium]
NLPAAVPQQLFGARIDGHDAIEWIAAQPWCNGKVGISGRSAGGIMANLAAAADPEHLVCAYVVTAPESLFNESYYMGGIFREHFRGNFMRLQGAEDQIPSLKARVVLDEKWKFTDLIHHRHNHRISHFFMLRLHHVKPQPYS